MENNPKKWAHDLVAGLNDGMYWHVPDSGLVFRIDKRAKTLVLLNGDGSESDFHKARAAMQHIGYSVITSEQEMFL